MAPQVLANLAASSSLPFLSSFLRTPDKRPDKRPAPEPSSKAQLKAIELGLKAKSGAAKPARTSASRVVAQATPHPAAAPRSQGRPTVRKTVASGPVLVFVAGVEGTGHHMLCASLAPRHTPCLSPCFKTDKKLEALARAAVFASTGAWHTGRAAMLERLRGYHQPASGMANVSHRRMMLQCTDDRGAEPGSGFKMSYPDDTLSLQRDSEKEGKATAHGDVALLAALAEQAPSGPGVWRGRSRAREAAPGRGPVRSAPPPAPPRRELTCGSSC